MSSRQILIAEILFAFFFFFDYRALSLASFHRVFKRRGRKRGTEGPCEVSSNV